MRSLSCADLTPNWFASVMGTGIVAVAAVSLPWRVPGLHTAAVGVWILAAALLVVLAAATAAHWLRYPEKARGHHRHPVMVHFYGAAPMAMLTVGAGALLLGRDVIGLPAALALDWTLWTAGTLAGLVTTVAVPVVVRRRHGIRAGDVRAYWLMPVVPPMVAASTGALLIPHLPSPGARLAMLIACYALFAISAAASAVVIPPTVRNVLRDGAGDAALVPTLWIVLGPLGQSVTAAGLLGAAAPLAVDDAMAGLLRGFALAYGIPVWLVALGWAGHAVRTTLRTAAGPGLPFGLPWWSFTFPVGTVVTATSGLATHLGWQPLRELALFGYVALGVAWALVAVRTAREVGTGRLLARSPLPATA